MSYRILLKNKSFIEQTIFGSSLKQIIAQFLKCIQRFLLLMSYKILIVDDDRELLKMLSRYFALKNYTVVLAENGIEALEKINANPDLILLDVNMPGMDGIEVCRRIRDTISCPIIFLIAKVEEQDRVMGLLSGGDDYVLKPFSLKELDARIIVHLKCEERLHRKTEQRFYGDLVIDYTRKSVQIKGKALDFTKVEYECVPAPATLEDAYIYMTNRANVGAMRVSALKQGV